ncbi:MAG: sodium/proton-translocating pyrophosphatase, partial [Bacteroidota bacterium]
MDSTLITYLIPLAGVIALIYAFIRTQWVNKQDVGTPVMAEIAGNIADGARAFLRREYRVLAIFVAAVAALLAFANMSQTNSSWLIAVSFLIVLNVLVIMVFVKTTSLRTPANTLVLGLSVSDFGIAIFSQPVFCVWIYAKLWCMEQLQHIFGTIFYYSFLLQAFVSFGILTTISADRFLAIHLHLRYKELVT